MDGLLTQTKWRQFLADVHTRWHFLSAEDPSIQSLDDIAVRLSQGGGLCRGRSQREVKEMVELFEEKIERAA